MWYENTETTDVISSFPKGSYDTGSIYHTYILARAGSIWSFYLSDFCLTVKTENQIKKTLFINFDSFIMQAHIHWFEDFFYAEIESKTAISWFKPE